MGLLIFMKRRKKFTIAAYTIFLFTLLATLLVYEEDVIQYKDIESNQKAVERKIIKVVTVTTGADRTKPTIHKTIDPSADYVVETNVKKGKYKFEFDASKDTVYSDESCSLPQLDFTEVYTDRVAKPPCKMKEEWGTFVDNRWTFNDRIKSKLTNLKCSYQVVNRIDDFKVSMGSPIELVSNQVVKEDVVEVTCKAKHNDKLVKFENLYPQIVDKLPSNYVPSESVSSDSTCEPMNVMVLSYDSISRVSWIKRLPLTYKFLTETMNTTVLQGYNVIGDGTPAALIPIYTGKTEEELPSALKNDPQAKYVDEVYPFIWKDLHKQNYMSMHFDDCPSIGAFTFRMRGFKHHTAKHYHKHYQLRLNEKLNRKNDDLCVGSKKRHKIGLDLIEQFLAMYDKRAPTITLMHYVENSHDDAARIYWMDDEIESFLNSTLTHGLLENTALFLFSDHGARFSNKKSSPKRYLEERMPFFSVYLPPRYRERAPDKYAHLVENAERLITPFDIYATLRDLTCMEKDMSTTNKYLAANMQRSISLLSDISPKRNCDHIGVSDHFCVCEKPWQPAKLDDPLILDATAISIHFINYITKDVKHLCERLRLKTIITAEILERPRTTRLFRIQFVTAPNGGTYETLLSEGDVESYMFRSKRFSVKSRDDFSRIDAYGNQPHCVSKFESNPAYLVDIRKFCYCIKRKGR